MLPASSAARGSRGRWLVAALATLAAVALGRVQVARLGDRPPAGDEAQYLHAALNLVRFGVLSHQPTADGPPKPTAYREPGYPTFLALGFWLTGRDVPAGLPTLDREAMTHLRPLKVLQVPLALVAALGAGVAAWQLTGRRIAAWCAAGAVALSPTVGSQADRFESEILAAALAAWLAVALLAASRRPGVARGAGAGALLAALVLTRAVFLYLLPALLVLFGVAAWREAAARRRLLATTAALALVTLVPVGTWALRNRAAVGRAILVETRGDLVLAIRAEFDRALDRRELAAAFLYWTPSVTAGELARAWLPDARLARLEWRRSDHYFVRALNEWHARSAELGSVHAAARIRQEALRQMLGEPTRHLAATVPLAWRGLFIETNPQWLRALNPALPLNLLLAAALAWLALRAIRGADWPLLGYLAPALFLFAFHALWTENLPRFNAPALPILWTALVVAVTRAVRDRSRRPDKGPAASKPPAV